MEEIKLFKHQKDLIDANPKKWGIFFDCGTGKTLTSIKLVEKNCKSALVICPKSIKENWSREIVKFGVKRDVHWAIIHKEKFRKVWAELGKYDCVIFDEVHFFGSPTSQLYKNAMKYLKKNKTEFIYLLTGTPYLSSPMQPYCYESLLGLEPSYSWYKEMFFYPVRMGNRYVPVVRRNIEVHIAKILRRIGTPIRKEDALDLPEQLYQTEYFELTKEQIKERNIIKEDPDSYLPIVRFTKYHQIGGGTLKGGKYGEDKTIESEKMNRLMEYCQENNKIVVVCRYNIEIKELAKRLNTSYIINGKTQNRQEVFDKFNADEKAVIIIQSCICEGYNLTSANTMIFYSNGFSFKDRFQMESRIHRHGQKNNCLYIDYVIKDTVDDDILASLKLKKDFHLATYLSNEENAKRIGFPNAILQVGNSEMEQQQINSMGIEINEDELDSF